jgi:hypothetical protein
VQKGCAGSTAHPIVARPSADATTCKRVGCAGIAGRDCTLQYKRDGRVLAVATIHRDGDSLAAEAQMEARAAAAQKD